MISPKYASFASSFSFPYSIAHPNNIVDSIFTERNFSLVMVVGFALLMPLGNGIVRFIAQKVLGAWEGNIETKHEGVVLFEEEKDASQRLITEYISPRKERVMLKEE